MNIDKAARDVDNALPAALNDTLVVKWALVAEVINAEGEHSLVSIGSPEISTWDKLGLLDAGQAMSRAAMVNADDIGERDDE